MMREWNIFFVFLFLPQSFTTAALSVLPRQTANIVGQSALFICSKVSKDSMTWSHLRIGSKLPDDIYAAGTLYQSVGRKYYVQHDPSLLTSTLTIQNVTNSDAGSYRCEDLQSGDVESTELIILNSYPRCNSNISLDNVLIANDCNVDRDYPELTCSVTYWGNIPPVMYWSWSGEPNVIIPSFASSAGLIKATPLPDLRMNGTYFVCSVNEVSTNTNRLHCSTPEMRIKYFYKSFENLEVPRNTDSSNVSCTANTSEPTEYKWKAVERASQQVNEIPEQFLSLTKAIKGYDSIQCYARFTLKNTTCIDELKRLTFFDETDMNSSLHLLPWIAILASLVLIAVLIIVIVILKRRGMLETIFALINKSSARSTISNCLETNERLCLISKSLSANGTQVTDFIEQNESTLVECLDPDTGLADCLLSACALTKIQHGTVTNRRSFPTYQDQNRKLLSILSSNNNNTNWRSFLEALLRTGQEHVFNYITKSEVDDYCYIITKPDLECIDKNTYILVKILNIGKRDFLGRLIEGGCITDTHKDLIMTQTTKCDRNRELLSILRRRSRADLQTFKDTLKRTKQEHVLQTLERKTGSIVTVHCESIIECHDSTMSSELPEIELMVSDQLNNEVSQEHDLHFQGSSLASLHSQAIHFVGASPTGSIYVFFFCETFNSVIGLKQMVQSGYLKTLLEDIFNRILGSTSIWLRLIVTLDDTVYTKSIEEARETIYDELDASTNLKRFLYKVLPREMLEMVLNKSFILFTDLEWKSKVQEYSEVKGGSDLYKHLSIMCFQSVNCRMQSVCRVWQKNGIRFREDRIMKRFFLRRLNNNYTTLVELNGSALNVLLNCMEDKKVLCLEDRKYITQPDCHNATLHHSVYYCHQLKAAGQVLPAYNRGWIQCFLAKKYLDILKILRIMEDNCLMHVLNCIISDEKLEKFKDIWPVKRKKWRRMTERAPAIIQRMTILKRLENRTDGDKRAPLPNTDVESVHRPPTKNSTNSFNEEQTENGNPDHRDDELAIETKKRPAAEVDENGDILVHNTNGNHPAFTNMIDLLFKEGCISEFLKDTIEKLPKPSQQNTEVLNWIRNGSIKTFKSVLKYLEQTEQRSVMEMLSKKYFSEDIQLEDMIEMKEQYGIIGVAWFENKIYAVFLVSKTVRVFSDQKPYEEEGNFEINDMVGPYDMVASQVDGSLFISDCEVNCLWKIQMPERKIKQCKIDGIPGRFSLTLSNELLVVMGRGPTGKNDYLDIYRVSDCKQIRSICLPADFDVWHAAQTTKENFVISYKNKKFPGVGLVCLLSNDGKNILHTFDFRSEDWIESGTWKPRHISIDEDDKIFIADGSSDRIFVLSISKSQLTGLQLLLNKGHDIDDPRRLCYLREKHQLVVGQWSSIIHPTSESSFAVFNLHPVA